MKYLSHKQLKLLNDPRVIELSKALDLVPVDTPNPIAVKVDNRISQWLQEFENPNFVPLQKHVSNSWKSIKGTVFYTPF